VSKGTQNLRPPFTRRDRQRSYASLVPAAGDRVVTGRLEDGTYLVFAAGQLDEAATRLIVGEVERISTIPAARIIVDVTRAGLLDSTAVGELRAVAAGADASGGLLVFVSDHPRALRELRGKAGPGCAVSAERTLTDALSSATLVRLPGPPGSRGERR
jgi:anti-anti-sigma regulatory factor